MNINAVVLIGNLTRDPELRSIPNGTSVCHLGVAVNEKYKDTEHVSYFDVTVWGVMGENCAKYLSKGSKVGVDGRLRQERWEKDGQKRSAVKIVADMVQFLDPKGGQTSTDEAREAAAAAKDEDSIPF